MATASTITAGVKRSLRLRQSMLVSFTAGSSLFSRASTAVVLIIAARKLSIADLGVFATLFGIAVAASYVIASTSGNILAYWTHANQRRTGRLTTVVAGLAIASFAASLPLYLGLSWSDTLATATATIVLLIAGVTSVVALQTLRGLGRLSMAVTTGFLIPAICRIGFSITLGGNVTVARMLGASALAASIGALVAVTTIFFTPIARNTISDLAYRWTPTLSIAAGTVGLMWFVLGQIDLTSLTLVRGSAAGGEYAPMMRAFEAMNALGLALAFVSIRSLAGASLPAAIVRLKRVIPPGLAVYLILTLPLLIFGHYILHTLLARHIYWSTLATVSLTIGYAGNLVMAVCFETLASQRATSKLFSVALLVVTISLAITPLAIILWGITGAAIANSLSYLTGGIIVFVVITRSVSVPGDLAPGPLN